MLEQYFLDELNYLRKNGEAFSRRFPKLASYLGTSATDPDIERLLEGFAFLVARLRAKVDDQYPELTHSFLGLICPQFLRPVPSFCILQMQPQPERLASAFTIPKHCGVQSVVSRETVCRFRTTAEIEVVPLTVLSVTTTSSVEGSAISILVASLNRGPISSSGVRRVRFFISGGDFFAQTLLLWLQHHLHSVEVIDRGRMIGSIPSVKIQRRGFAPVDAILPYPSKSFVGFRVLQEYYTFPEKFYFFDLPIPSGILAEATGDALTFKFQFVKSLPLEIKPSDKSFLLNCVPAVNLFSWSAEPIKLDATRRDHTIVPVQSDASRIEVFSIDNVQGRAGADGSPKVYPRFESFDHEFYRGTVGKRNYFRELRIQELDNASSSLKISLFNEEIIKNQSKEDYISIDLSATNGDVPFGLGVGELCHPTSTTPSSVLPFNVTRPTRCWQPILDSSAHWHLISTLSLNSMSLQDGKTLRHVLASLNFPARQDRNLAGIEERKLSGIQEVVSNPIDRLFNGFPVRGTHTSIKVKESHFGSEGELMLFANVLDQFLSHFSMINSFHELTLIGVETKECYRWSSKTGLRPLM